MGRFDFTSPTGAFSCSLQCQQCVGRTKAGRRCRKRTCIGTPHCWMHLLAEGKLRVLPSAVPNAGKGLFARAHRSRVQPGLVLFRRGDVICEYGGEPVMAADLTARYGDYTAPYGLHSRGPYYEDAACRRGAGSLANHTGAATANAKYRYGLRGGRPYSRLTATRPVRDGDEVLVNYGRAYRFNEHTHHRTR